MLRRGFLGDLKTSETQKRNQHCAVGKHVEKHVYKPSHSQKQRGRRKLELPGTWPIFMTASGCVPLAPVKLPTRVKATLRGQCAFGKNKAGKNVVWQKRCF